MVVHDRHWEARTTSWPHSDSVENGPLEDAHGVLYGGVGGRTNTVLRDRGCGLEDYTFLYTEGDHPT